MFYPCGCSCEWSLLVSAMADIGPPVRLLIILNDDNSVRLELRNGIPNSMEELIEEVKNSCGLEGYIRLQYKDTDFGNTFVNLTSTHAIKDLTVIKVVELDPDSTTVVLYPVEIPLNSTPTTGLYSEDSFSGSVNTDDIVLLSSSSSESLRTQQWPKVFPIPNLKRARRAEANHFPSLPIGETPESMEQERISLLAEQQKRNNRQSIKEKMAKTFAKTRNSASEAKH
ncbi:hypothetical protein F7725_009406 [Dissostichus mawsoni]|uniref:Uncharacterized protein n=1 Tax=Dissostichus mawsoni TaxID=36200 RepID=A0A7J5XNH0_DISMA|nr:hypothetical protein F7725_009406 [Dissostichus mawsoni]